MAMLFVYFLYVTVQGDRGIIAMLRLRNEQHNAEENLAQTRKERTALEARVKHLRPDSIDADLLDEEARRQLNMAKPNDLVVIPLAVQESAGRAQKPPPAKAVP